jgi:hypothetical protein
VLIDASLLLVGGVSAAVAKNIDQPDPKLLLAVLKGDREYALLIRDMQTIRGLLLISSRETANPLEDLQKFTDILTFLEERRDDLFDKISADPRSALLSSSQVETAITLASVLEKVGINRDSTAMQILIRSYFQFNQCMKVAGRDKGSLRGYICDCYPFSTLC